MSLFGTILLALYRAASLSVLGLKSMDYPDRAINSLLDE